MIIADDQATALIRIAESLSLALNDMLREEPFDFSRVWAREILDRYETISKWGDCDSCGTVGPRHKTGFEDGPELVCASCNEPSVDVGRAA